MKFSVIMPVYLQEYANCSSYREERFIYAVKSFQSQTLKNSELIIISDGCDLAEQVYSREFSSDSRIRFDRVEKNGSFGGNPRNRGLEMAEGDLICYLDSDDFLGANHLKIISESVSPEFDWFYYDDYYCRGKSSTKINVFLMRMTKIIEPMRIGTCSIVHKRELPIRWEGGYGHDHIFIQELKDYPCKKIKSPEYFICHIPDSTQSQFDIHDPRYLVFHQDPLHIFGHK